MGWLRDGSIPLLSRRGGCTINKKIPFLSGADGVVGNFKQNKDHYAGNIRRLRDFLLTTPGRCAASPPLKEGNELASTAVIDFEIAPFRRWRLVKGASGTCLPPNRLGGNLSLSYP